jgi:ABC-type multidrug transport system fused ATPase/permease subunit
VVGEGLATELRRRLFASMLNQDVAFFDSHMTGEIVSRLTADVQEFKSAFKQVNNWLNNYLLDKLKVSKNEFYFSGSVRRPKVNKSSPRLCCQSVPHFP